MMIRNDQQYGSAPIGVGIVGLGRSGWNIHAKAISQLPDHFVVTAVSDLDEARCAEARERFGCQVHPSVEALLADNHVDLVVVASPNHLHPSHVIDALHAGKHVICEKPMAMDTQQADAMIATARQMQRHLWVFHNRRFEPHFLKLQQIIASGVLGRIVQVRTTVHQFTRRWDWQTLRQYGGGMLNNIGSHLLDLMLELFPVSPDQLFTHLDCVLSLGDAEDHCVVLLKPDEGPLLHMEISNAGAYRQNLWLIMGSRGTLYGNPDQLHWKIADFKQLPQRQLQSQTTAERVYPHDDVSWQEHHWQCPDGQNNSPYTHQQFYMDIYRTFTQGTSPHVSVQSVRRLVNVLEQCRTQSLLTQNAETVHESSACL
ncbi:MAG: Gfo/Idh/MocA family protein [Phycisphaeraceae bacterium JB051]